MPPKQVDVFVTTLMTQITRKPIYTSIGYVRLLTRNDDGLYYPSMEWLGGGSLLTKQAARRKLMNGFADQGLVVDGIPSGSFGRYRTRLFARHFRPGRPLRTPDDLRPAFKEPTSVVFVDGDAFSHQEFIRMSLDYVLDRAETGKLFLAERIPETEAVA